MITATFNQSIQQTADNIIAMSVALKDRMESWADVFVRLPDSQNVGVTAGFITNWTKPNVMELLVEIQAPADETTALVRVQAIETAHDDANNERFNQVSLHFTVDYGQARQLVEKGADTTREDIAELLHAESSQLARIIVSNETGKDSATGELLGKRQDLDTDELTNISPETEQALLQAIQTVLTKLEKTAQQEAST